MNADFWAGKRVFLTGHTGFKGSWLSLWLQSLGAELTGCALPPPTAPSLYEAAQVGEGMRSIMADIRDLPTLQTAMQDTAPEIVIHMAAQSRVRHSYIDPVETYSTNVMGTVHLLEAVRHTPSVKAVVIITTDKCYENREWLWGYRENEPMGGYDPYSNSKGCVELVSSAYRLSFFNANTYAQHGVAVATARSGNVIGGGDWSPDRLIPDILAAFESEKIAMIRNPQAIRPWLHVLEPLRGYLTLAERLYESGPMDAEGWNFGCWDDDVQPVGWIAQKMADLWGGGARWQTDDRDYPHESAILKLDISKAKSRLGWYPVLPLEEALGLIIDWSRQRQAGVDIRKLTLGQINVYQAMAPSKT
ncbi:CDP-glucose 4,6-dehydratase [Ferrovum sp.]|uniref:CDP-glucose 4,6-dehydratase n=1 Tax=Ferrovum sp. TaxID=2609467 RepID=UPI002623581D|nr:CDP-glucose 4,6-dehydratase [Ferrovum sp.]